ncbi:MAG TPA: DUF4823 domain-containing protein [Sulfurimonas sp.]|uniref:DUF4823 domain-containing protein n=1 Tax=Sulfurimonas sp. TaxID=2022749 RepID=UPI002CB10F2C|nr:DUF4823 domain-containing protein [Sulfurimonas sp.]HUH42422.1 DUF4823 domain-containing protein [Sulfurimonas sp.]
MKKYYLRAAFIIAVGLFISGCAGKSDLSLNIINGEKLEENQLLTTKNSIYLVNGGDGMKTTYLSVVYGEEIAEGSGLAAVNIANEQLCAYTAPVVLEKLVITEKEALENAKLNQSDYVIYSRVEKWTDPLGINCTVGYYTDEASVVLSLYSTKDEKLLNTTRLSKSSCPFKINNIPVSTGSAEILYEELFANWKNNMFAKVSK